MNALLCWRGIAWIGLALFQEVVEAQDPPALEVRKGAPPALTLSWPAGAGDYLLESVGSLGAGEQWIEVSAPVQAVGNRNTVSVVAGGQARFYRLRGRGVGLARVAETSPAQGESGVAVTRETIFRLTAPLAEDALVTGDDLYAEFAGRRLLGRPELSSDRRTLTLFYLENLPSNARVRATLRGEDLAAALDADGDGRAGGVLEVEFTTTGAEAFPNTAVEGRVFASEKNADGSNQPLWNVTITVDGAEETLRATTDQNGFFRLSPAPAGRFFAHVDGRTALGSQWPGGAYYPFVGKAWEAAPGRTNLAAGTGEIFLPLIQGDALRAVSATAETKITFSESVIAKDPALAGVEINVPANSLFSDNGARGGRVGMAPVPPDRLPEPLPPGLNLPLVITIQTDGGLNFDRPVPVRFPNLPDPVTGIKLGPGEKTVLWSFNHDTGKWESQGTATISADGLFAVSDPGAGVRQPGWHGVATGSFGEGPGGGGGGGGLGPNCRDNPETPENECAEEKKDPCDEKAAAAYVSMGDLALDALFAAGPGIKDPVLGCGFGAGISASRTARDCLAFSSDQACVDSQKNNVIGTGLGCVPVIGSILGLGWGAKGLIDASFDWYDCEQTKQAGASSVRPLAVVGNPLRGVKGYLDKQIELAKAASNLVSVIYGSKAWYAPETPEDMVPYRAFFQKLSEAVADAGPGGETITTSERAELTALPRPSGAGASDVSAAIARAQAFVTAPLDAGVRGELLAAYEDFLDVAEPLQEEGWPHFLYGLEKAIEELTSMQEDGDLDRSAVIASASRLEKAGANPPAPAQFSPFPRRALYYRLLNLDNGFVIRGRLHPLGIFDGLVLAPGDFYRVDYFDPETLRGGTSWFRAKAAGERTRLPAAVLLDGMEPDSDLDGAADRFETTVGTDPAKADSDGDGSPDGIELRMDGNPLDGVAANFGLVAAAGLPRLGVWAGVQNNVAAVFVYETGLEFFDVTNPLQPVRLSSFPEPDILGSELAMQWPHVLVTGSFVTRLLDISDPSAPKVRWSRDVRGYSGAIAFGRAYVSGDTALAAFDLETGQPVETINYDRPFSAVQAVGDLLIGYPQTGGGGLEIARLSEGGDKIERVGGLAGGSWDGFFAEPGFVYMGDSGNGFGYQVVDISNPSNPSVVGPLGTRATFAHGIRKDSGNTLLALTRVGNQFGENQISIYDQSSPAITTNFTAALFTFGTSPTLFAIYQGRVFAPMVQTTLDARSPGNFHVYNYKPFDSGTNPPTVQLAAFTLRQDPLTEQSLGWFRARALAKDDAGVRNVEFYVDGAFAADVGSHPFETDLRAPALSGQKTSFVVRARAFDTAGNSAVSQPLTINLIPEIRGPRLVEFTPPGGTLGLTGTVFNITARFNEPILPATFGSGFRMIGAGPDGTFGTSDDGPLPLSIAPGAGNNYSLSVAQPLAEGRYQISATADLTDLFGNRLFNPTNWTFAVRPPQAWKGGPGAWADASKWSLGRAPGLEDFVRIEPQDDPVRLSNAPGGALGAHQISARAPLLFSNSFLTIGSNAVFYAPIRIANLNFQDGATFERGISWVRGGLEAEGGLVLRGHKLLLDSPGVLSRFGNEAQLLLFANGPNDGASFIIEKNSMLEVSRTDPNNVSWRAADSQSYFENRGVIRKVGGGTLTIGGSFRNKGVLQIVEGTAQAADPGFENFGAIDIQDGAIFRTQGGTPGTASRHFQTARFSGGGTNHLAGAAVFEGEYAFGGTTVIEREVKEFRGGVRSPGAWMVSGNPIVVRGLFGDFSGPVYLGLEGPSTFANLGRMQFFTSAEAVLHDLRLRQGELSGNGRLRIRSPVVISNSLSLNAIQGGFTARFEGPVELNGGPAGFLRVLAGAKAEFAGSVRWKGGPVEMDTNSVVLAGAEMVVEGSGLTELRGIQAAAGLRIEGKYQKLGSGANSVQRLLNSGLVEIREGVVQALVSRGDAGYQQSGGELRLAGGALDVRLGNQSSTQPGEVEMNGGIVTGAGKITGNLRLSGGTLRPDGVVEVAGEVTMRNGASFAVDIGGVDPGAGHDQLRAAACGFGGKLEVSLRDFQPEIGQEFVIATYARRLSSEFAETQGLSLAGGRRFVVSYEPTRLVLRVAAN